MKAVFVSVLVGLAHPAFAKPEKGKGRHKGLRWEE